MRKPQRLLQIAAGAVALIAAASLSAQTFPPARFYQHSYNISAGGFGGYNTVSTPRPTIPFTVARADGTATGTIELRYPDTLPDGIVQTRPGESSTYLVLSSPITVSFRIEFDYVAYAPTPAEDIGVGSHVEISSEHSFGENTPCKVDRPLGNVRSGTTTHFTEDFQCTLSRVAITVFQGEGSISISNYFDFVTFSRACICGFLSQVYANYRATGSEVIAIEPGVISNDPSRAAETVAVKITGKNFEPGSTVSLGDGIRVISASVVSPTEIQAMISLADGAPPASARRRLSEVAAANEGPRDVTVIKPGGTTQVGKDLFYVSSLAPAIGVNQGVPIACRDDHPCVADHDSWVRVGLPCNGTGCANGKTSVTGRLHVKRNGEVVPGSPFRPEPSTIVVRPAGTAFDPATVKSGATALNFRFAADVSLSEGSYDFAFEIDPQNPGSVPSGAAPDARRNLIHELKAQPFRRSRFERAIYVSMIDDRAPRARELQPIEPLAVLDFIRAAFPISRDLVTIGPSLYTYEYPAEESDPVSSLRKIRHFASTEQVHNEPALTHVVLFTGNGLFTLPGISSCANGQCWGKASIVKWDPDEAGVTLAHELGHHQGLGDTYADEEKPGSEDRSPRNPPCGDGGCPVETGNVDTVLGNVSVKLPVTDPNFTTYTKRDMMGNTPRPQRWINQHTWDDLYFRFMPGAGSQRATLQERRLVASGTITADDAVTFDPFISYAGTDQGFGNGAGEYRLELQDAQGASVSAKAFPEAFKVPHSADVLSAMPFEVSLLFPANATRVVVKKGAREIASRAISPNPPVVAVSAPNGGETIGASTTISWTASDADGDPLTYSVLYSPDGAKWSLLAADLISTSHAWTTASAPGSRNARIMVVANDGVHSTSDTSDGPFTVAGKAPLVTFTSPPDGAAFPAGQPVSMSGFAYDLEDGELSGTAVTFTSDRSGALGTGSTISATNLATGSHTITLRATDHDGTASTAQIRITIFSPGSDLNVVPVVGSTPGSGGSFFKTAVQIHNPTLATIAGNFVYHPQGQSGSTGDPASGYMLLPGQTIYFADLLPELGQSGLGTVDLIATLGPAPTSVARIFNDAGPAGTTGMTEELMRPSEALETGEEGVLVAPPEPSRARFNIGVRSLDAGATIRFTVRDASGAVRTTGAKFLPATYFAQQTAEVFLGIAPLANDTVTFEVDVGSAIVYGATTDNTTQDPSLQFARPFSSRSDPRRTIAAVAAAPGVLDSLFRTTLQLHNPTAAPISGRLVFHPGGFSGTDSDPSLPYALPSGATISYADILAALGRTGLGSLDIVATTGPAPLAVARVFNDGGVRGTTGFSVDAARPEDALQSGETGVLIAPADPAATRFNVGIRTFDAGASLSVTVRNRDGQSIRTFTRIYAPNYFEQQGGSVFLGAAPAPSDSVSITVTAGSAIVYGASTDNKTQDPAIQVARAIR